MTKTLPKWQAIFKLTAFTFGAIGLSSGKYSLIVAMVLTPIYLVGLYYIAKGHTSWIDDSQ